MESRDKVLARLKTNLLENWRIRDQIHKDNLQLILPFAEALARKRQEENRLGMYKTHLGLASPLDWPFKAVRIDLISSEGGIMDSFIVDGDHFISGEFGSNDLVSEEERKKELTEYEKYWNLKMEYERLKLKFEGEDSGEFHHPLREKELGIDSLEIEEN